MGAKQPKVKTYDDTGIQRERMSEEQKIRDRAHETQKGALEQSKEAQVSLDEGLGLLSLYLDSVLKQQRGVGDFTQGAIDRQSQFGMQQAQNFQSMPDNLMEYLSSLERGRYTR